MAVICNMQDVSDVRSERRIPLGNLGGRLPAICQRMGHLLDMATDGTPNVTMRFSYEPLTVFTQKRGKKIKLFFMEKYLGNWNTELAQNKYIKSKQIILLLQNITLGKICQDFFHEYSLEFLLYIALLLR